MAETIVTPTDLVDLARTARQQAYAPYSHYRVGAAVLTADGQVFVGCNVENAEFGSTVCAERVAIWSAVAAGHREFLMLAVVTSNGGTPCGSCRQVLVEFAPDMMVFIADTEHIQRQVTVRDLLPSFFGPQSLPHDDPAAVT